MNDKYPIHLKFIPNEADEDEGLGNAGIEIYKDAPYAGVARECGQNSADADASTGKPVTLIFNLVEIPTEQIPASDDLVSTVEICLQKARNIQDDKAIDFFIRAKEVLNKDVIKILEISDYNTTGLTGPSIPGTPFHSLVKGTGVCKKERDTSGGSFGIGKNAVFAISELRTVFYSTIYRDESEGKEKFLCQGKCILISHLDEQKSPKRGIGYWVRTGDNYEPISNMDELPNWLQRNEIGTSIFAIAFRESADWQYLMAASIVTNFFCAIHRNQMEFKINRDEIIITSSTLREIFDNEKIRKAAEDNNDLEDFEFSKSLYQCLTSNESREKKLMIDGFGNASIRTLVKEGLPNRMCVIRKGMVITDTLKQFGDRFKRFAMYSDFVALVEPTDDEASTMIRKLENPSHDGLSAERIAIPENREKAIKAMKELAAKIREAIKEVAYTQPQDNVALDEMSEFFADDDRTDRLPDPTLEIDPESPIYTPVHPIKRKRRPILSRKGQGEEGGAGGLNAGKRGGGGGMGSGKGSGTGGSGPRGQKVQTELIDFRNIIIPNTSGKKRKIFFTPSQTAKTYIQIMASGIFDDTDLTIVSATNASPEEGGFSFDAIAGTRTIFDLEFSEPYEGPIEYISQIEVNT